MLPIKSRVDKLLYVDTSDIVARLITDTANRRGLNKTATAFYAANLVVDSDWLRFSVEPWAPDTIPHQQLYDSPIFGNTCRDDARDFRARGFGRVVGRANYQAFSHWSGIDCVTDPMVLEDGLLSYTTWEWLWCSRNGAKAAQLALDNFDTAIRMLIGWPDRIEQRYAVFKRNLAHDYH